MSKVIRYMPDIQGDEQLYVAQAMKPMTDEQAENFARVYRQRRKDENVTLITALLGFFVVAGVHRFYLGQVGMGLLYLFTGGLCLIGTVVDAFNYKSLTYKYNQTQIDEVLSLIEGVFPDAPKQLSAEDDEDDEDDA